MLFMAWVYGMICTFTEFMFACHDRLYVSPMLQGKTHRWALAWSFSALSPDAVLPHSTVLVLRAPMGGSSEQPGGCGGGAILDRGSAGGSTGLAGASDNITHDMDSPSTKGISSAPAAHGGGSTSVPSSTSTDSAERHDDLSSVDDCRKRTADEPPATEEHVHNSKRTHQDPE